MHTFSDTLRMLCSWATSQFTLLSDGTQGDPQLEAQLADMRRTHASDGQRSADQLLSGLCGYHLVNLTRLSFFLSSAQAAAQGGQSAWLQQTGIHQLLQLMQQVSKKHVGLINTAVDMACRCDGPALAHVHCNTLHDVVSYNDAISYIDANILH